MRRFLPLLVLLVWGCTAPEKPRPPVPTPPPAPPPAATPNPPAKRAVTPPESPSRLPVERERRRFVPPVAHRFKAGEEILLSARDSSHVWVYASLRALRARDTDQARKVPAGTYAAVLGWYVEHGALEIELKGGSHYGQTGTIERADAYYRDAKGAWRR